MLNEAQGENRRRDSGRVSDSNREEGTDDRARTSAFPASQGRAQIASPWRDSDRDTPRELPETQGLL